jgi:AraC family transcriptional regulator
LAQKRIVHLEDPRGLRVVERWHAPQVLGSWHVNERPALTCVLNGALQQSLRSETIDCGRHSVLFKPAGQPHANRSGPVGAHCIAIEVPWRVPALQTVRRVTSARTHALITLLVEELRTPEVCGELAIEGLVLELLAAVGRTVPSAAIETRPVWLDGALEELRGRFRDPLPIREIAAAAGVTPAHFARVLSRYEGQTPSAYVRRLRIDWTKIQLLRTDRTLAAIALDAGFADQSHFTRTFASLEGVTPGRFRSRRS